MPCPVIDRVTIGGEMNIMMQTDFSIRPKEFFMMSETKVAEIETTRKYSFSWLGDSIPIPRAVFYIHGKRYLCNKITATFTENGMSELMKGEFYRLKN